MLTSWQQKKSSATTNFFIICSRANIFFTLVIATAVFDERYGEFVEVPLASALAEALTHNSIEFPLDEAYMNARQRRINSGAYPVDKNTLTTLCDPFFSKYTCADNRSIYLVCPYL